MKDRITKKNEKKLREYLALQGTPVEDVTNPVKIKKPSTVSSHGRLKTN